MGPDVSHHQYHGLYASLGIEVVPCLAFQPRNHIALHFSGSASRYRSGVETSPSFQVLVVEVKKMDHVALLIPSPQSDRSTDSQLQLFPTAYLRPCSDRHTTNDQPRDQGPKMGGVYWAHGPPSLFRYARARRATTHTIARRDSRSIDDALMAEVGPFVAARNHSASRARS